jgi:hypothetical protein
MEHSPSNVDLRRVRKPDAGGPNAMTQSRLEASEVVMTRATAVVRSKSFIKKLPRLGNIAPLQHDAEDSRLRAGRRAAPVCGSRFHHLRRN